MNSLPPKVQNQIAMLQQVQQQLSTIMQQKMQYEMMEKEAKKAQEELKDISDDANVYVSIGSVMMQQGREKVVADITEKIDTFELRIKSLDRQEKALQSKLEQLQAQVKAALEGGAHPPEAQ
jgi:prefoldin beta subunit